jgi:hypothetical protein
LKFLIFILTFFALVSCSGAGNKTSSESYDKKQINLADNLLTGLDPEKVKVCFSLASMARSAVHNKEIGLSKEAMLSPLPSRTVLNGYPQNRDVQKMMGLAMHDIVHEVYDYETLVSEIYSSYTAEVCLRKLKGVAVPEKFSEAHEKLQNCNTEEPKKIKILCAMAVAGSKP